MTNADNSDFPQQPILPDRAAKLRAQASNCIAVALEAANDGFVADLIDEAAMLLNRAGEISGRG
jgi:hypothetical protein